MNSPAGARHPRGEARLSGAAHLGGAARLGGAVHLGGAARPRALTPLCGSASLALLCGLAMCALLLAARRGTAAAQPLAPALLPIASIVLALVAWSGRALGAVARAAQTSAFERMSPLIATSASLLLMGLALGAAGRPWWAALSYWTVIALEEGWAWRSYLSGGDSFRLLRTRNRSRRWPEPRPLSQVAAPTPVSTGPDRPHRLTQEYSRASLGEGQEQIRGVLHLHVPEGARTAIAHVGFCPPFAERPRFEMRLASGPPCRLKVGQLLPQGARIEIKLHAPLAAAQTFSLEFTADGQEIR